MTAIAAADALVVLIRANQDVSNYAPGCGSEVVRAAEGELGVCLPPSYRRLVEEFGAWDIAGEEFLGIIPWHGSGNWPGEVVYETLRARGQQGLPEEMVVTMFDGMGGLIVIDTACTDEQGECPVRAWTGTLGVPARVDDLAPSFGEYALRICEKAVLRWRENGLLRPGPQRQRGIPWCRVGAMSG